MTAIKTYKTYMFKDKDPAIDELRTLVEDSGESYDHISEKSGVAASTLYQWFHGETRRPHNCSLEAVGRALGFKREFVAMKSKPKPKAKRPAKDKSQAALAILH